MRLFLKVPTVKTLGTLDTNLGCFGFLGRNLAKIIVQKSKNLQDLARSFQEIQEISRCISRVARKTKNKEENARGFKIPVWASVIKKLLEVSKNEPMEHRKIYSVKYPTSRDRPKLATYLKLKNSKRTPKCQSILFYSTRITRKLDRIGTPGETL